MTFQRKALIQLHKQSGAKSETKNINSFHLLQLQSHFAYTADERCVRKMFLETIYTTVKCLSVVKAVHIKILIDDTRRAHSSS